MQLPELRPHQKTAVENMSNGKILFGGVGSGKSLTAVAYYMAKEAPRDVYVITTAMKRDAFDWEKEFIQYNVGKSADATAEGAGVLTVDSWNNIGKYKNIYGAFFILDEQRLVGSGAWVKSFLKIAKKNHWIILSGTPGDNWMDYVPVFVANGFYRNRTEFIADHVVYASYTSFPKIERYLGEGKLIRLRNQLLVEMPYEYHTKRHSVTIPVKFNEANQKMVLNDRWNIFEDRPIKNVSELFSTLRKVSYSDEDRYERVLLLMQKHPKLIVFYNFNYELESLRKLDRFETTTFAEWNGHKHEPVPETDRWVYLVQYTAGAEGWNCTTTDAMVFHSMTYSYKQWHQAHGRIDRMNTPFTDLYYYTLMSNSVIDKAVKASLDAKKDFNEKRFVGRFTGTKYAKAA